MSSVTEPSRVMEKSLHAAFLRGSVLGIAVLQVIPLWGILTSHVNVSRLALVTPHLALALICVLVVRRRVVVMPLFVALYVTVLLDYAALDRPHGALFFGTAWISYVLTATPALLLRGRAMALFPAASTLAIAVGLRLLHPDWAVEIPVAGVVATATLTPAAIAIILPLRRLAARADDSAQSAALEHQWLVVTRRASRTAAELARTLHDTVINTLAALADARNPLPADLVRTRCAEDARRIESLIAGTPPDPLGVETVPAGQNIEIRRTGASPDDLQRYASLIPEKSRALRGAIGELVQNAAKHSGSDAVTIDARHTGDHLRVTVSDAGVGFVPDPAPGRGLAESVIRRCTDADVSVRLDSAPGRGTTVTLECSLEPERVDVPDPETVDVDASIDSTRLEACWRWAACLTAAEVVMEVVDRRGAVGLGLVLILAIAALCFLAWWACRRRGSTPTWLTVLLCAAVPGGFVLGFAGVGWGNDPMYMWQAISLSPLIVVLLVTARPAVAWVAVSLLTTTATVMTVLVWADRPVVAATIPACGLFQLCQFVAWWIYDANLIRLVRRSVSFEAQASQARLEQTLRNADAAARERWRTAGLGGVLTMLSSIADGSLDLADPDVRARCGAEERHLRQLIMLDPALVRLGPWLTRALFEARTRGVSLTLRTGSRDLPDDVSARSLGRLAIEAVSGAPHGSEVTVSMFEFDGQVHVTLVGPAGSLDIRELQERTELQPISARQVQDQYIVESSFDEAPSAMAAANVVADLQ
ncbi:MAG TPA: ATP-binding protein [Marmoricola sp.]